MIVNKESSILGYSGEGSTPLNADHHTICKFSSSDDPNYRLVVSIVKSIVANSLKRGKHFAFRI